MMQDALIGQILMAIQGEYICICIIVIVICLDRVELERGDRMDIHMSRFPLPTVNKQIYTLDWFGSLQTQFKFNDRPKQKPMKPEPKSTQG